VLTVNTDHEDLYISVLTVNTEDLPGFPFSEDENNGVEIGWNGNNYLVNVATFISAIGAKSYVPENSESLFLTVYAQRIVYKYY